MGYAPLVSIVIPTYNNASYIGRTLDSVVAQTYGRWEAIVVDDGSTDETPEIVGRYHDARIKYRRETRRGVERLAETMNVGVQASSGELVTMLGSDDRWPADRLALQVPEFEDPRVVLCFGREVLIDEHDRILCDYPMPAFVTHERNCPVGSVLGSLLQSNWIPQPTELIRRQALDAVGGYLQPAGLLGEDYPTHLALALQGEFRFVDHRLGFYRMQANQQTRLRRLEMSRTDTAYALEFYRRLSPAVQALTGLTDAGLARTLERARWNAYFSEGRRTLLRGDRRAASRQFLIALREGGAQTRAKAAAGLLSCATGLDLERVARWCGRPPLH
jgi:hypothetical protein